METRAPWRVFGSFNVFVNWLGILYDLCPLYSPDELDFETFTRSWISILHSSYVPSTLKHSAALILVRNFIWYVLRFILVLFSRLTLNLSHSILNLNSIFISSPRERRCLNFSRRRSRIWLSFRGLFLHLIETSSLRSSIFNWFYFSIFNVKNIDHFFLSLLVNYLKLSIDFDLNFDSFFTSSVNLQTLLRFLPKCSEAFFDVDLYWSLTYSHIFINLSRRAIFHSQSRILILYLHLLRIFSTRKHLLILTSSKCPFSFLWRGE